MGKALKLRARFLLMSLLVFVTSMNEGSQQRERGTQLLALINKRERDGKAVSLAFELANGRKKRKRSHVGGTTSLLTRPSLYYLS